MTPTKKPEEQAREQIDRTLGDAGWVVQDRAEMNLAASQGVAVREFKLTQGHGFADYLLFVGGKAVGVFEAKPAGYPLTSVEFQTDKYSTGLPTGLNPPINPLPFLYMGTDVETRFINLLDPDPKTRRISDVPHIHRPSTLDDWLKTDSLDEWVKRLHSCADLDEFVGCYRPGDRHNREATWSEATPDERWRPYGYDEIINRDKVSLDLRWLRDESLEDSASLPDPHILAQEIADDLRSALEQIEDAAGDLEQRAEQ